MRLAFFCGVKTLKEVAPLFLRGGTLFSRAVPQFWKAVDSPGKSGFFSQDLFRFERVSPFD